MPDILASQVAAGEVVERPASVVKELVENSLDADAHTILVEIMKGGSVLIKVTDDGIGMSQEDALLSLERHATSKLSSIEGLFSIQHLGFRGEALPSIASVSRLKLSTRERGALEGSELNVVAGIPETPKSSGIAHGTSIEVRELFFNTPARKKFLKSQETENAHIEHQLKLHALAFPDVRFILRKDTHLVFDLPATHDLKARIVQLTNPTLANALISIPETLGPGIAVSGFLLPVTEARRNKKGQFIFLNKRPVEDQLVGKAIRDGFGGFPAGFHPALYLYLDIEPALVDVNVHPAKREVRFLRPSDVVATIIEAISSALSVPLHSGPSSAIDPASAQGPTPQVHNQPPIQAPETVLPASAPQPITTTPPQKFPDRSSTPLSADSSIRPTPSAATPHLSRNPFPNPEASSSQQPIRFRPLPATQSSLPLQPQASSPTSSQHKGNQFRYLGILNRAYALFEASDGLAILHPRAARERIIYESLTRRAPQDIKGQPLLDPVLLDLDPRDFATLQELTPYFEQAGISMSPFGQKVMRIESLPALLKPEHTQEFILALIERIGDSELGKKMAQVTFETFAAELAQKSARLEKNQLVFPEQLLEELLSCEIPYCTPQGRPTLVMYSMTEIDRKFFLNHR